MSITSLKKHLAGIILLLTFSVIVNSCESDTQVTGGGDEQQTQQTIKSIVLQL